MGHNPLRGNVWPNHRRSHHQSAQDGLNLVKGSSRTRVSTGPRCDLCRVWCSGRAFRRCLRVSDSYPCERRGTRSLSRSNRRGYLSSSLGSKTFQTRWHLWCGLLVQASRTSERNAWNGRLPKTLSHRPTLGLSPLYVDVLGLERRRLYGFGTTRRRSHGSASGHDDPCSDFFESYGWASDSTFWRASGAGRADSIRGLDGTCGCRLQRLDRPYPPAIQNVW